MKRLPVLPLLAVIALGTGCSTGKIESSDSPRASTLDAGTLVGAGASELARWSEASPESIKPGFAEGSRLAGMRDDAISIGIQAGMYDRGQQLNRFLEETDKHLAILFDFNQVLLPNNLLPPVVRETNGIIERKADGRVERSVQRSYHIETDPVIVGSVPTYLSYLHRNYAKPSLPSKYALPKTNEERGHWRRWVSEGWEIGVRQASMQFNADADRLLRDYEGMQIYLELVDKGILTMPQATTDNRGITRSSDGRTLNIGDQVLSIEVDPAFTEVGDWKVVVK